MGRPPALAVLLVGVVACAFGAGVGEADAATGTACVGSGDVSVSVVIDFGSSGVSTTCVRVASGATGSDVLAVRAAALGTPSPRFNPQNGLLCAIDGYPAQGCGETTAQGTFYWSYWQGGTGGWSYAQLGPSSRRVSEGSVEGWRFGDGSGDPSDSAPSAAPDHLAICVPPTAPETVAPAPTLPPETATPATEPAPDLPPRAASGDADTVGVTPGPPATAPAVGDLGVDNPGIPDGEQTGSGASFEPDVPGSTEVADPPPGTQAAGAAGADATAPGKGARGGGPTGVASSVGATTSRPEGSTTLPGKGTRPSPRPATTADSGPRGGERAAGEEGDRGSVGGWAGLGATAAGVLGVAAYLRWRRRA